MGVRRTLRVFLAVTLAVCAVPLVARAPGSVVIGTIVDAATSRGIAGAVVHLQGPGANQTHVTDAKGRFFFVNLLAGSFEIVAEKSGYYAGAYGRLRANGDGLPLEIATNQWIADVSIPLFKPAVVAGFVTDEANEPLIGVRVDAMRREQVAGRWRLTTATSQTTDDRGQYRIGGLRPGEYVVVVPSVQVTVPIEGAAAADARDADVAPAAASYVLDLLGMINGGAARPGARLYDVDRRYALASGNTATPPPRTGTATFAYPSEYYPGVDLPTIAAPLMLVSGERREGINFQLRPVPTSRVSGVVLGPDGPVGSQLLRLMHDDVVDMGLGSDVASTVTTSDGRFQFLDVPAGRYILRARHTASAVAALAPAAAIAILGDTNDATASPPVTPARALWGDVRISVAGGDIANVVVAVEPSLVLSGRVAVESSATRGSSINLSGARIQIDALDGSRSGGSPVMLTSEGAFTIGGLTGGSYLVRVSSLPAGWVLKSAVAAGRDVADVPLEVYGGVDPPTVTVTLTDQVASLNGTIHDARGLIATTATVLAFPVGYKSLLDNGADPRRFRAIRASQYGVYKASGLPGGDYNLIAVDESTTENWQDVRVLDRLAPAAMRVTLRTADRRVLDLRISRVSR